jgi:hypothetical protein
MEKRVAKILMLAFMVGLFVLPLVSAGFIREQLGSGWAGNWIDSIFGTAKIQSFQQFLIFLAVFLIIFVASADIISSFSGLSSSTSWIIGFALALIVSTSGGLAAFSMAIFGLVAGFGAVAIAIVIGSAFFVAIITHLGFSSLAEWIHKRNLMIKAGKGSAEAVEGLKAMKAIGKEAAK